MNFAASLAAAALAAMVFWPSAMAQPGERAPDFEVRELASVDPFEVGVTGGALPQTVWSSGEAASLRAIITALPESAGAGWRSAPAARMALRALLSGGPPPEDLRGNFDLAAMRAGRALAAGHAEPVYRLLLRTPRMNESPALSRIFAETAFALGHTDEGCRAADALLTGRETAYWLRARAACLALQGNIPAAELTAELARAQGTNETFELIFDAFTLNAGLPPEARPRSGLQLGLAAAMAGEERISPAEDAPPWLKRAAERTGPAIDLPELLSEALEAAEAMTGADRAAALGALIQQDLDREIAAEALAMRLDSAARDGRFVDAAIAYGPEVARLPITEDTLAHGVHFVFAALAADDVIAASAWREALVSGPVISPERPDFPEPLPGFDGSPSPPASALDAFEAPEWQPPPPDVMVAIDFALAIAEGRVTGGAFAALLAARIEHSTPERLCHGAALAALGANDGGSLRAAMTGLQREAEAPAPVIAPGLLAAAAGALGESQLHAARLLNRHPGDAEACAAAAFILERADLRHEALRFILELVIEDAV